MKSLACHHGPLRRPRLNLGSRLQINMKKIILATLLISCSAVSAGQEKSDFDEFFPAVKSTLANYDNVYGRRLTDGWLLARIVGYPLLLTALLTRDYCAELPNEHEPKGFWGEIGGITKHAGKVFAELFTKPQEIFKKHRLIRIATLLCGIESGAFGYFKWKKSGAIKTACEKDFPGLKESVALSGEELSGFKAKNVLVAGQDQEKIKKANATFDPLLAVFVKMLKAIEEKDNATVLRMNRLI